MKIRIMKQEVLEKIKDNIDIYIKNYFCEECNDWLYQVCDCNPFEDFKEINDFSLASTKLQASLNDFENCKILYSNLHFLNESQASDERLWAGLANDLFYSYLRERFDMNKDSLKKSKNPNGDVVSRFFFKNSGRSGYFRNYLAKCWWVGHHTYDEVYKFQLLDTLGSNDMSTKVTDIFHNYTFTSSKNILKGIIDGIGYFNANKIKYSMLNDVRPVLQYINAIGGSLVLDVFSSDEIRDIFIRQLDNKLNGKSSALVYEKDYVDEVEDDDIIDDSVISLGDKVAIAKLDSNDQKTYIIKSKSETDFTLPPICDLLIGKRMGDIIEFENVKYKINLVYKN